MPDGSFGLALQELNTGGEKVLVASSVARHRVGGHWFKPQDVQEIFGALRVPPPGDIPRTILRLSNAGLMLKRTGGGTPFWAITPLGEERARNLLEEMPVQAIEAELQQQAGSYFGDVRHAVIPPAFAPPKWLRGIGSLLETFPFETNVFLMTRFPEDPKDESYLDPMVDAINAIREACRAHGLHLHLASDRQLDDDLLGNVAAHMWACQYGVGILENRLGRGLNYNVVTELGGMLMTGRRCALFKDHSAPSLPSDIAGHIYKPTDLDNAGAISQLSHSWIADDLGLGRCPDCTP